MERAAARTSSNRAIIYEKYGRNRVYLVWTVSRSKHSELRPPAAITNIVSYGAGPVVGLACAVQYLTTKASEPWIVGRDNL